MDGINELKEFFTLKEASKVLSDRLGDDISVSDLLQLGLYGKLKISINFTESVPARRAHLFKESFSGDQRQVSLVVGKHLVVLEEYTHNLLGIYDIMLKEGFYEYLRNSLNSLLKNEPLNKKIDGLLFVKRRKETYWLCSNIGKDKLSPISEIPDGCLIVIRSKRLKDFICSCLGKIDFEDPEFIEKWKLKVAKQISNGLTEKEIITNIFKIYPLITDRKISMILGRNGKESGRKFVNDITKELRKK